jgi:hypothetical protein
MQSPNFLNKTWTNSVSAIPALLWHATAFKKRSHTHAHAQHTHTDIFTSIYMEIGAFFPVNAHCKPYFGGIATIYHCEVTNIVHSYTYVCMCVCVCVCVCLYTS